MGYDNIMNLAKEHGLKKIMVMRNTWGFGSWCIVNKVVFKPNGYGSAYGYIHFKCAGNYVWRVVKVLDEMMETEYEE